MGKKIIMALVVVLMLAGMGGSGYLWHQKTLLETQIADLNTQIDKGKRRERMLQKKYTQEKAKTGTCMRAKLAEESKRANVQKELKAAMVRVGEMEALRQADLKKHEAKLAVFEKRIEQYKALKEKLVASRQTVMDKYRAAVLAGREKAEQIQTLTGEKKELESLLSMTESALKRSNKHNTKLCQIAEELTVKYRERAGKGDPFTRIAMVEMEHLIQTYIKRIDKEKIVQQ